MFICSSFQLGCEECAPVPCALAWGPLLYASCKELYISSSWRDPCTILQSTYLYVCRHGGGRGGGFLLLLSKARWYGEVVIASWWCWLSFVGDVFVSYGVGV